MKEQFLVKRFNSRIAKLVPLIEEIMVSYGKQGYDLTVRQVHYQLVSRFPELYPNTLKSYKMLVGILTNGRYGGMLDWEVLVDRNRTSRRNTSWPNVPDFFKDVPYWWQYDKWQDQPWHIEVMVEKDALSGILEPVCGELDISFTANKGYTSSSAIYRAAKRFRRHHLAGKRTMLIYLGDHDPSGIDMTGDITDRLKMLAGESITSNGRSVPLDSIKVVRLALNMAQVKELDPPENFAKDSDSRTPKYTNEFGEKCWELDAIEPAYMDKLLRDQVKKVRNAKLWKAAQKKEETLRKEIVAHLDKFGTLPK